MRLVDPQIDIQNVLEYLAHENHPQRGWFANILLERRGRRIQSGHPVGDLTLDLR